MCPVVCTGRCSGWGKRNRRSYKSSLLRAWSNQYARVFRRFCQLNYCAQRGGVPFFFFSALPPVLQDFRCTPLPLWYVQIKEDMRVTVFIICFLICFKGLNVKKNILLRLLRSTSPIHLVLCKLMLKSTCIKCNIKPQSLILCFFFI